MSAPRNTIQKKLIAEIMENNLTHPTADEVYTEARKKQPRISRATVYRVLNIMSKSGQIKRLTMPYGSDHYDSRCDNHYHFFCRKCYRVFDTDLSYDDSLNMNPSGKPGFHTEWHRLLLCGLCDECSDSEKKQ
jgi:Fur family peroxide stress response transcriptional regulator